jgi:HEAT repeat protein
MKSDRFRYSGLFAGIFLLALTAYAAGEDTPFVKAWSILNPAVTDKDIEKRTQSVSALGLIVKNEHAEEMANSALNDPKPEVRAAAANALGQMEATRSIPVLKNALKDSDAGVVLAAAHALLVLHDKYAYEVYYAVLTGERKSGAGLLADQRKMLDDPKKMAQFGFETGVGFLPFGGLGLTAIRTLTKDDASPVRASAAKILANDPDPKSGEALVTATSDKSWIVRAAALDAIARRGDKSLESKIVPALDDDKPAVQYIAAAAVIRLNDLPASRHSRAARKPAEQ